MSDVLKCTFSSNGIVTATIHRPEALNAINFEVMAALETLLKQLESQSKWRVFVLRGQGTRSFVSGGDLKAFATLTSAEDARAMSARMGEILNRVERLSCWTIAHINGDAYGGGCETMAAFDFRYAHADVHLGWTQARFGLTPGWGGLTRLVELVGHTTALAWLAGASRIGAMDAQQAGFLTHVSADAESLEHDVQRWSQTIARHDRDLIAALKQGAKSARWRAASIHAEREPFAELWASETHHQKVAAFVKKTQS